MVLEVPFKKKLCNSLLHKFHSTHWKWLLSFDRGQPVLRYDSFFKRFRTVSPALRMLSSFAWVYILSVIVVSEWPRRAETLATSAPSAPLVMAILALVWRSKCGWKFSIPYLIPNILKYPVGLCGCIGSWLSSRVNTHCVNIELLACCRCNCLNKPIVSEPMSILCRITIDVLK